MKGVAITDHDTLSSHVKAIEYLQKKRKSDERWNDLKLILGNEIYLCRDGLNKTNYRKDIDRFYHFILLAKDEIGHKQIMELSARAWKRSYTYFHRRIPTYYSDIKEVIGQNPGHVVGATACLGGFLSTAFVKAAKYEHSDKETYDDYVEFINEWLTDMSEVFGKENFLIELQPGLSKEQLTANPKLLNAAKSHGLTPIITTDSHYLKKEDKKLHAAFLNSKGGDRETEAFYEATFMMDSQEIHSRMDENIGSEEVSQLLANTLAVGDMFKDYQLTRPLKLPYLPRKSFDEEILVEPYGQRDKYPSFYRHYESPHPEDRQLAIRLHNFITFNWNHQYGEKMERVEFELQIIEDSGKKQSVHWSRYFLQMADYCKIIWNRANSLIGAGRGSGGASYILYALDITQIDPTREKAPLLFTRFMNPDRASVLDVDIDVMSTKRNDSILEIQKEYGEDHVIRVATFRTEQSKSAVKTAARGLGIPVDDANFVSSLIGSERGLLYTLTDMVHGNPEKGIKPNQQFLKAINKYDSWLDVATRIEGLVNGIGVHAGGIIITEDPVWMSSGVMASNSGEFITAFELHDCEKLGDVKIDLLATQGMSKIGICLDLLVEHGYIERLSSLRETYEESIGIYNLERNDPKMWKMVEDNQIISLFQMEQQSGVLGISLVKPKSVEQLAVLNSAIRLMASERGAEQPLDKYARFKSDRRAWDSEMDEYGLTGEEKKLLHGLLDYSDGIAAHQEDLYQLLTHPLIAGMSLGEADVLRKAVAKKHGNEYDDFEKKYWENAKKKGLSEQLTKYVWNALVATQRGYSFRKN